jgi:hypothetical protein
MRRLTLTLVAGLLVCATNAAAAGPTAHQGAGGAGHNVQTERLEAAFKIALFERAGSADGCYTSPSRLAAAIRNGTGLEIALAGGFKAVKRQNVVHLVKSAINCNRVVLALLSGRKLFVLDSARGPVYVRGQNKRRAGAEPGQAGPLRALSMVSKSASMTTPDEVQRVTVLCPPKTYPMGGGMSASPAPGPDGEGIYPHSYERLGVQRGWHVNPVMIDPSPGSTTQRRVTVQVICAKGLVPTSAPHKTAFLKPGQTKTLTARCPKGSYLFSGGFQRTDVRTPGGDYVTESRAVGTRAWRVSGRAFGLFGGELTAIAHCVTSKRPLITEVSASNPLPAGQFAQATTPACPKGRRLTAGGFSANGSHEIFFADGIFNANGTWTASGFGYFGPAPKLTAFGYCLQPGI